MTTTDLEAAAEVERDAHKQRVAVWERRILAEAGGVPHMTEPANQPCRHGPCQQCVDERGTALLNLLRADRLRLTDDRHLVVPDER